MATADSKPLNCPRCTAPMKQERYGPCFDCRSELRRKALEQRAFRRVMDALWPGSMDPTEK